MTLEPGKTTFLLNIAYQAASQKHPVLYVSYEVGYSELRVKLASMKGEYTYSDLCRNRQKFIEARKALVDDSTMDYLKVIDASLLTEGIDSIKAGIATLKKEFPKSQTPLLIVDYLQGMPIVTTGDYRLSIASCVQKLRDMVRQEEIVIIVASATNNLRSGSNAKHAGVFRESSEIEYSSYIAMILGYQDEQLENGNVIPGQEKFPYLFIVKQRFGRKYTKGIPLKINWETQRYCQREGDIL